MGDEGSLGVVVVGDGWGECGMGGRRGWCLFD